MKTRRITSLHNLVEQYRFTAQECIDALQYHMAQESGSEAAVASLQRLQEARHSFGVIKSQLLARCGWDPERVNDMAHLDHSNTMAHLRQIVQNYNRPPMEIREGESQE